MSVILLYSVQNMRTLESVGNLLEESASKISKITLNVEIKKTLKSLFIN